MLLPVIMAGGTGSRLWPMSRELYPKQFLKLHNANSMLQETLTRLHGINVNDPIVICNKNHCLIVAEQLRQIGKLANNIILEPIARNTAPAIALAAINAISNGENPIMLVLAADHIIKDEHAFHQAIQSAIPYAERGYLVTFGIVPTGPETGYGYIQREKCSSSNIALVKRFVEKPNLVTAQKYVDSGNYFWNSGMFMFHAQVYLDELKKFRPNILSACQDALKVKSNKSDFIYVDYDAFSACSDESIDYAVMEKTQMAVVVPLDAGWSDVGSWSTLWEISAKDDKGNVLTGDTLLHDTYNCYINTDEKLVTTIGVNNLVIVNTKDAVLVVDKSRVQDVKKAVEFLKDNNRIEYKKHREIYNFWEVRDVLVADKRFNVNKIIINPGEVRSSKIPNHKTERWIILSGAAKVTINDKISFQNENQSIHIPKGTLFSLENPSDVILELIEIQIIE